MTALLAILNYIGVKPLVVGSAVLIIGGYLAIHFRAHPYWLMGAGIVTIAAIEALRTKFNF